MSLKDLRNLSVQDLRKKEQDLRKELFILRIKKRVEGLKDINQIRKTKRQIARVLTVLRQKELRSE
ncbi:MAG: 50S ribosomal protein L29 [Aquificaceae bacterium]|nr:50S ribosomal protein L29 [Aquificaceae bacterium]